MSTYIIVWEDTCQIDLRSYLKGVEKRRGQIGKSSILKFLNLCIIGKRTYIWQELFHIDKTKTYFHLKTRDVMLLKFSSKFRTVIFSIHSSPKPSVAFGNECYFSTIFFTESTSTLALALQLPLHRIFNEPTWDTHSSGARALVMLNQAALYCTLKY